MIAAISAAVFGSVRLVLAEGAREAWPLFLLTIPGQVSVLGRGCGSVGMGSMKNRGRSHHLPSMEMLALFRSHGTMPEGTFVPCSWAVQVAVCLLPISLPIYVAMGEALATARLLAFLELMLGQKR